MTVSKAAASKGTLAAVWLLLRVLRWVLWIAFFATCFYVSAHRDEMATSFGQLPMRLELLIYALGTVPVFIGFFEMMAREEAGLPKPAVGRDWSTSRS